MKLNPKQQAFVDSYCVSRNATEAYKQAGYSVSSDRAAAVSASRLLTNVDIATQVNERFTLESTNAGITAQFILEGIKGIAIDIQAREADRLKAYELLGKSMQLFTDKIQIEGNMNVGVTILDDIE